MQATRRGQHAHEFQPAAAEAAASLDSATEHFNGDASATEAGARLDTAAGDEPTAEQADDVEQSTQQNDTASCESVEQSIISLVTSDFAMQVRVLHLQTLHHIVLIFTRSSSPMPYVSGQEAQVQDTV